MKQQLVRFIIQAENHLNWIVSIPDTVSVHMELMVVVGQHASTACHTYT